VALRNADGDMSACHCMGGPPELKLLRMGSQRRWSGPVLRPCTTRMCTLLRLLRKYTRMLKNTVFCDVTPCGSCKNRRFGGMYRLHHQGDKNRRTRKTLAVTSNRSTLQRNYYRCSWLTDYCHPDGGGETLLRKVGSYKSHAASNPRRRHSS
jgi:hypothetical protein